MASAPDFDRKMLLLATQLANESDMKALLLSVLETLLKMVQNQPEKDIHVEGLSLIRCVIRLVVKLMGEPAANGYVVIILDSRITLISYFPFELYLSPNSIEPLQHRYRCRAYPAFSMYDSFSSQNIGHPIPGEEWDSSHR